MLEKGTQGPTDEREAIFRLTKVQNALAVLLLDHILPPRTNFCLTQRLADSPRTGFRRDVATFNWPRWAKILTAITAARLKLFLSIDWAFRLCRAFRPERFVHLPTTRNAECPALKSRDKARAPNLIE